MTRLHARRDQEVARALGGRLEQRGGLDLGELGVVEGLAHGEGEVAAHLEVGHHLGTTDVEVAVAQAHVLGGVDAVLDLERGGLRGVEDLELVDEDLDVAGGHLLVVLALGTLAHDAGDLDRPLGADVLGGVERGAAGVLGVEGDLRHAVAVAKVDEDETAVVAAVPDPTGERDGLADVIGAQLAAGVGVH